jgi:hypothetical protein
MLTLRYMSAAMGVGFIASMQTRKSVAEWTLQEPCNQRISELPDSGTGLGIRTCSVHGGSNSRASSEVPATYWFIFEAEYQKQHNVKNTEIVEAFHDCNMPIGNEFQRIAGGSLWQPPGQVGSYKPCAIHQSPKIRQSWLTCRCSCVATV